MVQIGEEFTAFRREFMPFAIGYYNAKLQKMVKEQMAVAEALNPGSTIKLGARGEAEQAVEPAEGAFSVPSCPQKRKRPDRLAPDRTPPGRPSGGPLGFVVRSGSAAASWISC
jgi:hypothetical protein